MATKATKHITRTALALSLLLVSLQLLGCPRKKGPFERAGEAVDRTVDDIGEAAEDVGDNIAEADD